MTTPPRPDAYPSPTWSRPQPRARRDPALWIAGTIGAIAVVIATLVVANPRPPVAVGPPSGAVTATPVPSASTEVPTDPNGAYSFLAATFHDGRKVPVRWNPCQPIEYELDLEVSPPGAERAIGDAFAASTAATGIAFKNDGATHAGAHALFQRAFLADALRSVYRPVLITIVSHRAFRTFETPKRVVAFTRPQRGTGLFDDQWVAGAVVVDGGIRYPSSGRWSLRLVIQHELGHLLGLDHVTAGDELMFSYEVARSSIPDPIDGWGPGDLAGLQQLGADQGCLRTIRVAA